MRATTKTKDPNRGFKTAPDGRLIITDIEDEETDSDDEDMTGYDEEKDKDEIDNDDSSDDEKGGSSKKKIALNPYKAGGSGIHRPLAESVKSGVSNRTSASKVSKISRPGSDYKAKKAGGDVKKKGKHEPYAYIQLSRNSLNRRKRKAAGSSFKNIAKKSKKKSRKA